MSKSGKTRCVDMSMQLAEFLEHLDVEQKAEALAAGREPKLDYDMLHYD